MSLQVRVISFLLKRKIITSRVCDEDEESYRISLTKRFIILPNSTFYHKVICFSIYGSKVQNSNIILYYIKNHLISIYLET